MSKIIILGMGNRFFGDDGVGIVIAKKLKAYLIDNDKIKIDYTNWGGLRIIDLLSGYDYAIIIDAIKTGKKPVGYIHKLDYKEIINSVRMISFHDVNFATAVEFGKQMGISMPEKIKIYAIEIKESEHFSENLTKEVNCSVKKCTQIILKEVSNRLENYIKDFKEVKTS